MMYTFDCHVHTGRSFCGEDNVTMHALVELMDERGLKGFAITDHSSHFYFDDTKSAWNPDIVLDPGQLEKNEKKASRTIKEHLAKIRSFSDRGVLAGMEVDFTFTGELVIPPGIMDELDIVIGALHWLPGLSRETRPPLNKVIDDFMYLNSLLLEKDIDILAHPTRIFKRSGMEVPEEVIDPLIDKAIACSVALEINSHSIDPDEFFVKRCLEKGAILAMGTDTHSLDEFGVFDYHRDILNKCGVTDDDLKDFIFLPGRRICQKIR